VPFIVARSFDDIAEELKCSNAAVRKRVIKLGLYRTKPTIWEGHDIPTLMTNHSMNAISRMLGDVRVRKVGLTHLIRYKNVKVAR